MDYINKNSLKIVEVLEEKEFYFNELYEKVKIRSKNNLLRNLKKLTEKQILIKRKNKSNTYYTLNYTNLLTFSLLDLLNKERFESLPFSVKKSVLELIFLMKPKIAILFGSYAKGSFKKESDVDLVFIDSEGDKNIVKEIGDKYGVVLNVVFLKFKEFDSGNSSLTHILKTGFPIVGKEYFYDKRKV